MDNSPLYHYSIQPQEVDFQYQATLATIANLLLTTSGKNADDRGFGSGRLQEIDCTWVLSKLAIEMIVFPKLHDKIKIRTWVEEAGTLSTIRNFTVFNENNEIIGCASSHWAMINVHTRRPKKLELLEGLEKAIIPEVTPMERPIKLSSVTAGILLDTYKTKYSDIDINGHTNSVRYIEWINNCFPLDIYREKHIKRFEINYVAEVLFDETVSIYTEEVEEDDFRFEIRKDEKTVCKARMVWELKN